MELPLGPPDQLLCVFTDPSRGGPHSSSQHPRWRSLHSLTTRHVETGHGLLPLSLLSAWPPCGHGRGRDLSGPAWVEEADGPCWASSSPWPQKEACLWLQCPFSPGPQADRSITPCGTGTNTFNGDFLTLGPNGLRIPSLRDENEISRSKSVRFGAPPSVGNAVPRQNLEYAKSF